MAYVGNHIFTTIACVRGNLPSRSRAELKPSLYTYSCAAHASFSLTGALRVRTIDMIMTISHTCKSYPYDDHYQGYSSYGQHYVSRNFVSLCTYSATCKTPPPSEQEENLQMPFVHHGFNGKTLTTYSVLHGDKFSHLCLDENTSVYVSRGAYPNVCFTPCLCQVTSITYVAFSLWNSVHMICLRLSSFEGNISTLFSIAARLSAL